MTGHCSNCHKVWTLETRQGVCQWCGQPAICQTTRTQALRSLKSSPKRSKRQVHSNGNGYDQLDGEWLTYYKVASRFSHKAQAQDREDLLHDIMIALAVVARNNGHKPVTEPAMYRIASVTIFRKRGYNGGGEKMPAIHMSKKELNDLIEAGKASGADTNQLEVLLAEVAPEKPAGSKARPVSWKIVGASK